MESKPSVLVLGATGGIGGEVARQLRDTGWTVRALKRGSNKKPEEKDGISWCGGDALNAADIEAAAAGSEVIVHAVNPPGYRNWSGLVLPMLDNSLAAAKKQGATVVLPGNLYNYGPDAFPVLTEDAPQLPLSRKGAIRVEMEQRLRDYAEQGGRVIIVRAGDFFGPRVRSSWFSQGLVQPGRAITTIRNPGSVGTGHQWSYLPDVARIIGLLLERRESLDPFAVFQLAGHWDADGTQMVESIRRVVARHAGKAPRTAAFPWWSIRLLAPFNESLRELLEMRYLWQQPVRLNNTRLKRVLGQEPSTPLDVAVETTLRGLGCLPGAVSE